MQLTLNAVIEYNNGTHTHIYYFYTLFFVFCFLYLLFLSQTFFSFVMTDYYIVLKDNLVSNAIFSNLFSLIIIIFKYIIKKNKFYYKFIKIFILKYGIGDCLFGSLDL